MGVRPRILVVDDDRSVLLTYSIILRQNGYDVIALGTLAEALQALDEGPYNLLICDLSVEHARGGFDVIDGARQREGSIPAILLTGFADVEVVREVRQKNVTLLVKPVGVEELLHTVAALVSGGARRSTSTDSP